ncbi:MAG: hypothetical protein HYT16_03945 [DPANN group archaeon]|nr:hypothetical protein [DPANN group archaeon]
MAIDLEQYLKPTKKGGGLVDKPEKLQQAMRISPHVQFIGVHNLKPFQEDFFKSKINSFYSKILKNYFNNVRYFAAEVKLHEKKDAGRQKHSIHLRLALPSKTFSAEYAGFDLDTPLSRAIKALETELVRHREKTRERREDFNMGRKQAMRREFSEKAREEKFEGIKERGAKVRLSEKRK